MNIIHRFEVAGMTCKNCKAHVERGISTIDGVEDVYADLETGEVSVTGRNISFDKIKEAVEMAGYIYKGKI